MKLINDETLCNTLTSYMITFTIPDVILRQCFLATHHSAKGRKLLRDVDTAKDNFKDSISRPYQWLIDWFHDHNKDKAKLAFKTNAGHMHSASRVELYQTWTYDLHGVAVGACRRKTNRFCFLSLLLLPSSFINISNCQYFLLSDLHWVDLKHLSKQKKREMNRQSVKLKAKKDLFREW